MFTTQNWSLIEKLLRSALQMIGGILIARGAISSGNYELISGLAVNIATTVWMLYAHRETAVINTAAKIIEEKKS